MFTMDKVFLLELLEPLHLWIGSQAPIRLSREQYILEEEVVFHLCSSRIQGFKVSIQRKTRPQIAYTNQE